MRAGNLRNRVVPVLRKPFGIKCLRSLIVENVLETVFPQEFDRLLQFSGELGILAIQDRIDVFLQEHLKQRTRRSARARAERAGDFGRQVAEYGHNSIRVACECRKEMTVAFRPVGRRKIGPVFV